MNVGVWPGPEDVSCVTVGWRMIGSDLLGRWFLDRKSTRLNSSHSQISYAVFCLKKKKHCTTAPTHPARLIVSPNEKPFALLLDCVDATTPQVPLELPTRSSAAHFSCVI